MPLEANAAVATHRLHCAASGVGASDNAASEQQMLPTPLLSVIGGNLGLVLHFGDTSFTIIRASLLSRP